jgi:hypothetical protein
LLSGGSWPGDGWHELLAKATVPYFAELVKNTRHLVEELGITDVHIGDYLYAEPSLVAAVVAQQGGKVHVWPHSTNPVHVEYHRTGNVSSVRAVTRSGSDMWRRALPAADVHHEPGLMLERPHPTVQWVPGEPISLVIIGGRPVMRHLPMLDYHSHVELHRRFFSALTGLVEAGTLRIYFKPRGLTGENEQWLETVVGREPHWEPILAHPLRLDLPNPVFMSISVASSALLEGVSRGIPGVILREGQVRDYLVADEAMFETLPTEAAVSWLDAHASAESWDAWRMQQVRLLASEFESPN